MKWIVLDWTLLKRWREDLGAPPQTWEQYSREGRIWDSIGEKTIGSRKKATFLRCMFSNGIDVGIPIKTR